MASTWGIRLASLSAAAIPLAEGQAARLTWNDCKCKKTWMPEEGDKTECKDHCCNPDKDPYGDWCMVEDTKCEESVWGYCQPKVENTIHNVVNCRDYDAWTDKDGDGCSEYADSAWCTMAPGSAVPGVGWHEEWGTIRSFGSGPGNISGFTACCACGGGHRDATAAVVGNQDGARHTWNSCKCKSQWQDPDLGKCNSGCCNLDHDPYGEWCQVEEANCEDADWGYCRPSGINTVHQDAAGCNDVANWKDSDGDTCKDYSDNVWCNAQGGYDLGWHDEWGTFDGLKKDGKSAKDACCACGGGQKDAKAAAAAPVVTVDQASHGNVWTRKTWNGCACKSSWEEHGLGSCQSSCCNPDNDEYGEWCMVVDTECEVADWGYCQPTLLSKPVAASTPIEGCKDKAGFKDSDGDSCDEYAANAWCIASGEAGVGWHEEWGDFKAFKTASGDTSATACCACGGGIKEGSHSAPHHDAGAVRTTWNGCQCLRSWTQGAQSCSSSCCNTDRDPFGDWCIVENAQCEESDWGYCKPEGVNSVAPWEFEAGGCTDSPGWKDADGDDCHDYRENNWCNSEGGYNTGWHEEWGTFANFAGGGRHETANQACCACGRGTAGGESTLGVTAATVAGRVTRNLCRCLKVWEEEGVAKKCTDHCCNPDGDPDGEWCFVEDYSCEESDWGYCMPANPGLDEDEDDSPTCIDKAGWKDSEGDDCDTYEEQLWCTKDGEVGVGWHEEWGNFFDFKSDTTPATEACCACGGGSVPVKEVQSKTSKILVVSIAVSGFLAFVLGCTAWYYRTNYNKILYAAPGQEHVRGATLGKTRVADSMDDA